MLHAVYLGVILVFCRHVVWQFLTNGIFGRIGTVEESICIAIARLRFDLTRWYVARRASHPLEKLTEVNDITRKMVGENSDRKLKVKGAEAWGMLLFVCDMLSAHLPRMPPESGARGHLEAGRSLVGFVQELSKHPCKVPLPGVQACLNLIIRHFTLTAHIEDLLIPKRHMVLHMVLDIPYKGNPVSYANWIDESDNRTLKACCRTTSQLTFEPSVLLRMPF
jgi:hypothetical protein